MRYEIRQDHVYCEGYVCATMRDSRVLRDCYGPFTERVSVGCFENALDKNPGVEVWINHDRPVDARNFILQEDNIGLYFMGDIYDQEFITAAATGNCTGWSYGFSCEKDNWEVRDGMRYRTLEEINLFEVSLLVGKTPAYYATTIHCRDGENQTKEYRYCEQEKNECEQEETCECGEKETCECGKEERPAAADVVEEQEAVTECDATKQEEPEMEHPCDDDADIEFEHCLLSATIELLKVKTKF